MAGNLVNSIDAGPIGTVTLSNGQKIDVPKLSNLKVIKIVKFLGIDGMKLYNQFKDIVANPEMSEQEKWITILEQLPEETIIHILSILLDMSDEETLALDPTETLEIVEIYVDKTDLGRAFMSVRNLAKKMFQIEIPDLKTWAENRRKQTPNGNGQLKSS